MTFEEEFAINTKEAIAAALMKTIVNRPNKTLAEIYDGVEEFASSSDRDYIAETFRELTVGEFVEAYCKIHGIPEEEPIEEEGDEVVDLSEEGSGEEDGAEEDYEEEGLEEEEKEKLAPRKKLKKAAKSDSFPFDKNSFTKIQRRILKTLMRLGAKSEEDAVSSKDIQERIEIDPAALRGSMNFFIENELVGSIGERRGKKYYLMSNG